MENLKLWRAELADGDRNDYADCYTTTVAETRKEAWKKILAQTDRPIKRIYEVIRK